MNCPTCDGRDSAVKDSRRGLDTIRRRRHCLACGFRFSTWERHEGPGTDTAAKRAVIAAAKEKAGAVRSCAIDLINFLQNEI